MRRRGTIGVEMAAGHNHQLIILGASARAAAFSALRAGWRPWCADLFADMDLEAICPTVRLPLQDYPRGFARLCDSAPLGPWIYTGALENYPGLLRTMAQRRQLWGNSAEVVRKVRRPLALAACLNAAGLPCPRLQEAAGRADKGRSWLLK